MPQNPTITLLDPGQVIKRVYDEANDQIRTNTSVSVVGDVVVDISATTDNIAIRNTNNTNELLINADGSINVQGTSTITGAVTIAGLDAFKTTQYTINTSVVQILNPAFTNRSAINLKATCTNSSQAIFIGANNSVTSSTGFPLFNGDTVQMDLGPSQNIYAIATAPGQLLYTLEIG